MSHNHTTPAGEQAGRLAGQCGHTIHHHLPTPLGRESSPGGEEGEELVIKHAVGVVIVHLALLLVVHVGEELCGRGRKGVGWVVGPIMDRRGA